ncbi:MAG: hypothetical protein ACYDDI_05480 [Candidatus Acidiferrales bacterium]
MPNPALLPCDTDVLVQLFLADDLRPLQGLKKKFGIQSAITLEVDIELRWVGRPRGRFVSQLNKALKHGTLVKLDPPLFQSLLGNATPGTSWSAYQTLGALFYGYIGRGEAYTHAAAVSLGLPAASNDRRAIEVMKFQMLPLPSPVLRCFDLLVFAYFDGILNLKDCEDIRKELLKKGEGIPGPFVHASFEDGLKNFPFRLRQVPLASAPLIVPCTTHYDPLVLVPL